MCAWNKTKEGLSAIGRFLMEDGSSDDRRQEQFEREFGNTSMDKFTGDSRNATMSSVGSSQSQRIDSAQQQAAMLKALAQQAANRGVQKTPYSPAQLNGLNPQNPQYFGMQRKNPVPYQKIVADGNNLTAVLKGFSENKSGSRGAIPSDTANLVAQLKRREGLIDQAFGNKSRDSMYAGVPRSAAVNLYQIELKNNRENSIYAFY